MSHAFRTHRAPPPEIWVGLDTSPHPDMTGIAFVELHRADAVEETLAVEARRTVLLAIAGLLVGLAIAALLDWITAGPGLRVMVGL